MIYAVDHDKFKKLSQRLKIILNKKGCIIDIKSGLNLDQYKKYQFEIVTKCLVIFNDRDNSVFQTVNLIVQIFSNLNYKHKKILILLLIYTLFTASLEIISLGIVVPLQVCCY